MSRQRETGLCRAWCKADGAAFVFDPVHYPGLLTAWRRGEAFYTGTDLYGSPITVKLGEIVAVGCATAEQVAACEDEDAADRLLEGDG